jgi:hypothetical protein
LAGPLLHLLAPLSPSARRTHPLRSWSRCVSHSAVAFRCSSLLVLRLWQPAGVLPLLSGAGRSLSSHGCRSRQPSIFYSHARAVIPPQCTALSWQALLCLSGLRAADLERQLAGVLPSSRCQPIPGSFSLACQLQRPLLLYPPSPPISPRFVAVFRTCTFFFGGRVGVFSTVVGPALICARGTLQSSSVDTLFNQN